jgi:hypothetical protein
MNSPTKPAQDEERELFEAEMSKHRQVNLERMPDGETYVSVRTEWMLVAFQAGRASLNKGETK